MSEARSCFPGAALYWNDRSDFPLDWKWPLPTGPFDPFPDESKARPIVELLEGVVRRFPQRIALCGPESLHHLRRALARFDRLDRADCRRDRTWRSGRNPGTCFAGIPHCHVRLFGRGTSVRRASIQTIHPNGSRRYWTTRGQPCFWYRKGTMEPWEPSPLPFALSTSRKRPEMLLRVGDRRI